MTNNDLWQAVLADFELKISKANFTTWFKQTGIAKYEAGHIIIAVPSSFSQSWLEKKYHADIVKTIERVTEKPVKKIEYVVEQLKNISETAFDLTPETEKTAETGNTPSYPLNPPVPAGEKLPPLRYGLNQKYNFTTFIVGKNNELAHAAARAVADRPGETYNPLFIYGGVGLGKTHLLQAIGNAMLNQNPNCKILYVSSERFTNDYVSSVKEGRTKEFKERYRSVDLLLIDDIQFIGGKEQT